MTLPDARKRHPKISGRTALLARFSVRSDSNPSEVRVPNPFRTCRECGHVYPTAADLLAEHAALVARINRESWPDTPPMVAQTDPDQVYACPACAHDF